MAERQSRSQQEREAEEKAKADEEQAKSEEGQAKPSSPVPDLEYGQSPGPDYPAVSPELGQIRTEPGQPAGPSEMADASLSQPPSPPSLAQASRETREAAMARAGESGEMGEIFPLWGQMYMVIPRDAILVCEVNPANDPRNVRVISKTLYEAAKKAQGPQS